MAEDEQTENMEKLSFLVNSLKVSLWDDIVKHTSMIVPHNDFPAKVVETAMNFEADLIVITANLDSSFKEFFVGTYFQNVVNQSKCPVLCVRFEYFYEY